MTEANFKLFSWAIMVVSIAIVRFFAWWEKRKFVRSGFMPHKRYKGGIAFVIELHDGTGEHDRIAIAVEDAAKIATLVEPKMKKLTLVRKGSPYRDAPDELEFPAWSTKGVIREFLRHKDTLVEAAAEINEENV